MTILSVSDNDARPQATSLLLTRLPTELRLWIYTLVFVGCQATAWFDGEYGDHIETRQGRRRKLLKRPGQCCFEHFDGGFALLTTCRKIHVEAFCIYWEETVLKVSRSVFPRYAACELQRVCAYLPTAIKTNVRHLRNTRLPILQRVRPTQDDPNWTPTLLEQFPNLKSCAFIGRPPLAGGLNTRNGLRVPGSQNIAVDYEGVGRFWVQDDKSPAAFIERELGVRRSCRVMFLSMARGEAPRVRPPGWRYRYRYFNYTTGMVYQTTIHPPYEAGFEEAVGAREGFEWYIGSNTRIQGEKKVLRRSKGV